MPAVTVYGPGDAKIEWGRARKKLGFAFVTRRGPPIKFTGRAELAAPAVGSASC